MSQSVVRFPEWHSSTASVIKRGSIASLTFSLQHVVIIRVQLEVVINQTSSQSNTQLSSTLALVQTTFGSTYTSVTIGGWNESQTVSIRLTADTAVQFRAPRAHRVRFTHRVDFVQWFSFHSVSSERFRTPASVVLNCGESVVGAA